ncbi:hypothetical protein Ssi03_29310 [Sphaerisporangium siamense]|nr:hypothetical protein Ssi03_29310 [Sphaerisporangium siamense]
MDSIYESPGLFPSLRVFAASDRNSVIPAVDIAQEKRLIVEFSQVGDVFAPALAVPRPKAALGHHGPVGRSRPVRSASGSYHPGKVPDGLAAHNTPARRVHPASPPPPFIPHRPA